jgi:hypothetical protein
MGRCNLFAVYKPKIVQLAIAQVGGRSFNSPMSLSGYDRTIFFEEIVQSRDGDIGHIASKTAGQSRERASSLPHGHARRLHPVGGIRLLVAGCAATCDKQSPAALRQQGSARD